MYQVPTFDQDYDPNFPPNLNIKPSTYPSTAPITQSDNRESVIRSRYEQDIAGIAGPIVRGQSPTRENVDEFEQLEGIKRYGIAGKVWDASYPILPYLSLPTQNASSPSSLPPQHPLFEFDPPCSIFSSSSSSPHSRGYPTVNNPIPGSSSSTDAAEYKADHRGEDRELTILELGSGQSLATLRLLDQLLLLGQHARIPSPPGSAEPTASSSHRSQAGLSRVYADSTRPQLQRPRVYLTDLPNVIPLCEKNIARWRADKDRLRGQPAAQPTTASSQQSSASVMSNDEPQDQAEMNESEGVGVEVKIMPLAWGDLDMGQKILADLRGPRDRDDKKLTHILLIDLIYFPHLYPLLVRTLLQVTGPPFCDPVDDDDDEEGGVGGPEVILTYKTRSLEFEEPFFNTLGYYFQLTPLLSRKRLSGRVPLPGPGLAGTDSEHSDNEAGTETHGTWQVHGVEDETYTYICRRWRRTLSAGWVTPIGDEALMNGGGMDKVAAERGFGWVEGQLGAIEWD